MIANELDKKVMEIVRRFDVFPILPHFELVAEGQLKEVENTSDHTNLYYQWLGSLMILLKPKQVVELGAAAGISTIMMALHMPRDSKLYSLDIDPAAWRWMKRDYPQVVKLLGDDLDMNLWPKDVELANTDVWFFDSLHTGEQLQKELDLYSPFFKKGAVLVFDDIHINDGMNKVWDNLSYDKIDNSTPCHSTGFGVAVV